MHKTGKTTIGFLLAAVMMFSMAACSNTQKKEIPSESVQLSETAAAETEIPAEPEGENTEKNGDIYILCTSDVHCGVDQGFGYAGLEQVRDTLEEKGYETILVDDGDSIQGEALGTVSKGEAIIGLMNAVGYDAAIPGNHEFDYGTDRFLELVKEAEYPYISCNFTKEGKPVFSPYIIKEAGGMRFAFGHGPTQDPH